jgi:hypothetical protein
MAPSFTLDKSWPARRGELAIMNFIIAGALAISLLGNSGEPPLVAKLVYASMPEWSQQEETEPTPPPWAISDHDGDDAQDDAIEKPAPADSDFVRGVLVTSFETSIFKPCDKNEQWLFTTDPENWQVMDDIRTALGEALGRKDFNLWRQIIVLEAAGTLGASDDFKFANSLNVEAVRDIAIASEQDISQCGAQNLKPKKKSLF